MLINLNLVVFREALILYLPTPTVPYFSKMKKLFLFVIPVLIGGCAPEADAPAPAFDPSLLKPQIAAYNGNFGKGIRTKNAALIAQTYDPTARLCPDNDTYVNGRTAIENWWKESVTQLDDMILTTISLEGTREVLYETGMATTTIHSKDSLWVSNDKYVNVWRLQPDSSYKIVIDIWNGLGQ